MSESKELILPIRGTMPEIVDKFEAYKKFYLAELERYEQVVTEETLPAAKKDLAKLRAEFTCVERIRIDETKRLNADVTAMGGKIKEITGLIQKAADKINSQVKKFEDETRELCRSLMKNHLTRHYEELEVRAEFRTGESMVESLVGISKVTSKGVLTKEAKENINGLAQQGRIAQDRVDGRIASIGAECLKAGLSEAMPKEYFERYLSEPDAVWFPAMAKIIKFEADRRAKEKADQEAREAKAVADALAAQQAEANRIAKEKADADAKAERETKEKADRAEKEIAEQNEKHYHEKLEHGQKPAESPPVQKPTAVSVDGKKLFAVVVYLNLWAGSSKKISDYLEKVLIEKQIVFPGELKGITVTEFEGGEKNHV